MKTKAPLFRIFRLLIAALALCFTQIAFAGATNSFFQNAAMQTPNNYSTGSAPNNTTDVLITTGLTNLSITDTTVTAESLSVSNGTTYSIGNRTGSSGNSTLTLGNSAGFTNAYSGVANDLIFLTNNSSLTIHGPNQSSGSGTLRLVLASSGNFSVFSGSTLTVSAIISGGFGITKTGSGILTLSGVNTFSGGTTLSAGRINLSGSGTLGAGNSTVTVSGGTLDLGGSATVTNSSLTVSGGIVTNGTFNAASYSLQGGTVSAALGGSGALTKSGSGTVTLAGNNSGYTGAVNVQQGTIVTANNNALGANAVTLTNGAILADNGRTIANNFTIGSMPATVALQSWDFTGPGNVATFAATFTNSSLVTNASLSLLTRGAGASASSGANSFRTTGFGSNGISTGNTDYFEWQVASSIAGMSLQTLDARFAGTGGYFAAPGASNQFAWSTNGTSFNLISSPFVMTSGSGAAMPQINLSGISELQNLGTNVTVSFRFYATGQTSTGGWGFNSPGAGTNGLSLGGAFQNAATGSGTLGITEAGTATFSGNIVNNNAATFTAASGGTATFSGIVSGAGSLNKTGAGTVTLAGSSANTFTGMTTVSAGTLQLNKTAGTDALAGDVTVDSGAFLLISQSNQVNNNADVTLSGGTITRGSGVNEAFASLNLTTGSFLDFGTGATGSMTFGTYEENTTPSALLTINNFLPGNSFTFSNAQFAGNGSNIGAYFTFGTGFQGRSISDLGGGSFTITAIPEPSTYAAAIGLLSLMLWPSRKRLIKDAKKILGFTPPMRDRLARRASEG
jgi:autotransporter-associated beta strand protein